jgi:predicted nucleic acid-binding protein
MATYLLDTSVIIDAINNKRGRRQFLRGLVDAGNFLACCPIHVAEVYAGLRPHEEPLTRMFLQSLEHGLPLLTDNAKDFPMRGISLYPLPGN